MNEIFDEIDKEESKKGVAITPFLLKILFSMITVLLFGVYVGNLLFGTNSFEVLLNLDYEHEQLQNEISKYKEENAKLQKEYFELKQLEPN